MAIVTKRPVPVSILREKDVLNYPYKALRELMMNACMHRDYQSNMPTRLYQYDSHIEVMNPGGLYGQARPENFPHVNDYRNGVVAEMMRTLNYVNMFNHGINEVQQLLKENTNPPAEFNVSYVTAFSAVVKESADDDTNSVDVQKDVQKDVLKKLSDRQRLIYKLVTDDATLTLTEMSKKANASIKTIQRDIEQMHLLGINIIREGGRKEGYWRIEIKHDKAKSKE